MKNNEKVLNTALKGLVSRLEKTEKFVLEQAPDICKQMVQESKQNSYINLFTNGLFMLISIVASVIFSHMAYVSFNDFHSSSDGTAGRTILAIISLAATIGTSCDVTSSLKWLLFLKNCPKLFLLREFRDLLK